MHRLRQRAPPAGQTEPVRPTGCRNGSARHWDEQYDSTTRGQPRLRGTPHPLRPTSGRAEGRAQNLKPSLRRRVTHRAGRGGAGAGSRRMRAVLSDPAGEAARWGPFWRRFSSLLRDHVSAARGSARGSPARRAHGAGPAAGGRRTRQPREGPAGVGRRRPVSGAGGRLPAAASERRERDAARPPPPPLPEPVGGSGAAGPCRRSVCRPRRTLSSSASW